METLIEWMLSLLGIYLSIGILVAIPFVWKGASKIDPAAVEGTRGFRILILPGAMIFWPLLLHRWLKAVPQPEESSAHRRLAARRNETPSVD